MSLVLRPPLPATDLQGRLAQLRGRLRFIILVSGIAGVLAAVFAFLALLSLTDLWLHWPGPIRGILLIAGFIGATWSIRRWIVDRWQRAGDDLTLARRVEASVTGVHEALASSVEFSHYGANTLDGSPQLRQATVLYAVRRTGAYDFTQAAESWPILVASLSLVGASVLLLQAFILSPSAGLAMARIFDPFGIHPFPTKTQLQIEAPSAIARGEPFMMTVRLTGIIPDRLQFAMALVNSAVVEQSFALTPQADGSETVAIKLEPARVPRSFRFKVSANDDATDWIEVAVQVSPQLMAIDGRPSPLIRLQFPAYTDLKAIDAPDGTGSLEAIYGTIVQLKAATDRPIRGAWVQYRPPDIRIAAGLSCMTLADTSIHSALCPIPVVASLWSQSPIQVASTETLLTGTFTPVLNGAYDLTFVDDSGLIGRWPIDARVVYDPSPTVTLEQPSNVHAELAPNSIWNLAAVVEDNVFALREVKLEYRTRSNESPRHVVLYSGPLLEPVLPSMLTAIPAPSQRLRPKHLQLSQKLPLSMFRHVNGDSLSVGDVLALSVVATDYDDVSPMKPPGRSAEVELRIVSNERLAAGQQSARQSLAKSLRELLALQSDALALATDSERQRRATGELRSEDREHLGRSIALQQQILERLGDERDGATAEANRLRRQMADNPGASPADQARANRISAELNRLGQELVPPIGPLLSAAQHESQPVAPKDRTSGPLPEAVRGQRDAERSLRNLLADVESGQEVAALAVEAGSISAEQTKLNRQREELAKSIPPGVDPNRLTEKQRQALEQNKEVQEQLGQRAASLIQQLETHSKSMRSAAEKDLSEAANLESKSEGLIPSAAQDLGRQASKARQRAERQLADADTIDKARDAAKGTDGQADSIPINERMAQAADALGKNQLGSAQDRQIAAGKQLDRIQDALREPAQPEADRLMKERREAIERVEQIIKDQESLQDRVLAAEQQSEQLTRKQQLEQLAREQERLAEQTREQAVDFRQNGQTQAAREIEQAAKQMDRAREQLEHGDPASSRQDDALEHLDNAVDRSIRDQSEIEDQLRREVILKLRDRFQGFKDRQAGLTAESERILQAAKQAGHWSRSLQKSLLDFKNAQKTLGEELEQVSDKHLKTYRVLLRLAKDASAAMNEINKVVDEARASGITIDNLDNDRANIQDRQQLAKRRLDQLMEALTPPKDKPSAVGTPGGNTSTGSGGDKPAPDMDIVSQEAQLKALRQLQSELKERIDDFVAKLPIPEQWSDRDRAKLEALRREQAELVQLFAELSPDDSILQRGKKSE